MGAVLDYGSGYVQVQMYCGPPQRVPMLEMARVRTTQQMISGGALIRFPGRLPTIGDLLRGLARITPFRTSSPRLDGMMRIRQVAVRRGQRTGEVSRSVSSPSQRPMISVLQIATARRMRRIYGIASTFVLSGIACPPASGQDPRLPDYTTLPTSSVANAPDDIREIIFTAVCQLPDTVRHSVSREGPLLPLVVLGDTVAFALTEYGSCRDRTDLSGIRSMEFIRGSHAVRMYGDRARAGVLRVFSKVLTPARVIGDPPRFSAVVQRR